MKIDPVRVSTERRQLLEGESPKLAGKQVDNVEDLNFRGGKENCRLSFRYDRDLGKNVAHLIDNSTGKTVKRLPTETEADHLIRLKRLMGLNIDRKA